MSDKVLSFKAHKQIKELTESIQELTEAANIIRRTLKDLTKYDKYSSIKKNTQSLFVLYQDTKRAIDRKREFIQRLENEKTMD